MIIGLFLLKLYHNVTDGWTDRRTDSIIAISELSRAGARYNSENSTEWFRLKIRAVVTDMSN